MNIPKQDITINAQGICPACGDIVWPEDKSIREGVRVYHQMGLSIQKRNQK